MNSRLEADFMCMKALMEKDKKWNFLINLCGQDFPIKSNSEIAAELKLLKGSVIGSTERKQEVVSWFHRKFGRTSKSERYMNSWYSEREATEEIRKQCSVDYNQSGKWYRCYDDKMASFPYGKSAAIYTGLAYGIFSRDFLQWFFEDEKTQELVEWSKHTWSPDEMVWATAVRQKGAPGKHQNANPRLILWEMVKNLTHGDPESSLF